MKIPPGHQTLMPYYIAPDAARFIDFTQKIFNAELLQAIKLNENSHTIIHGEIKIGDSLILFADASADWNDEIVEQRAEKVTPSIMELFVYVEDVKETYQKAIEAGAAPALEITDVEDGWMGGILDPFENLWLIKTMK
jgi:uncharacterized glyoxalase superfamily protein PhnB